MKKNPIFHSVERKSYTDLYGPIWLTLFRAFPFEKSSDFYLVNEKIMHLQNSTAT